MNPLHPDQPASRATDAPSLGAVPSPLAPCPSPRATRHAFSMIEILVAMVILMIIVVVFARFFQRSSQSWESGMRIVETAIAGRSAMNLIVRDIERAVSDPLLVDEIPDTNAEDYGYICDGESLSFISIQARAPYRAQRIKYYLANQQLMRQVGGASTPVISNVVSLAFVPAGSLQYDLPAEVGVKLRLSSRYDTIAARDQEFVARAFTPHRHRYP